MNVVVHDYSGHPGQIHLSRELARRGHQVQHQYCDSYVTGRGATTRRADDSDLFSVRAIKLHRDFAPYSPGRRFCQELQYARAATRAILDSRPDVAVLSNVPLLALWLITAVLRRRRVPVVFWQQDVYSHAIAVVARRRLGWLGHAVGFTAMLAERSIARRSAAVVPISAAFIDRLQDWGVARDNIHVIPNWAAIDEMPRRPRNNAWARDLDLADQMVVMYAGTLGLKHDPSILVTLAERAPIGTRTVVVSQGIGRDWLEKHARDVAGLTLLDYQPYEALPDMLATASVLVVLLEPEASSYSVPSKALNYLCAGRPILALLPPDNAIARIIDEANAGVVVDPSDDKAVTAALQFLLSDAVARARMGTAARTYAEHTFDVRKIADKFENVLVNSVPKAADCERQSIAERGVCM